MAVDNDDGTLLHSDDGDTYPWWLLDLGETRMIHDVQILPRRDNCIYRFHDIEVSNGFRRLSSAHLTC